MNDGTASGDTGDMFQPLHVPSIFGMVMFHQHDVGRSRFVHGDGGASVSPASPAANFFRRRLPPFCRVLRRDERTVVDHQGSGYSAVSRLKAKPHETFLISRNFLLDGLRGAIRALSQGHAV